MKRFILLAALLLLVIPASAADVIPQAVSQPELAVSSPAISFTGDSPRLSCSVRNTTDKDILGYVVVWELVIDGKTEMVTAASEPLLWSAPHLKPSETDESTVDGVVRQGKSLTSITASADYVLFADGTGIGPNKSKRGKTLKSDFFFAQRIREGLRNVYAAGGVEGLLAEIGVNP